MDPMERLIERQRQIESDSVRDGCARWCRQTEYQQATDTKPYRNLIGKFVGVARGRHPRHPGHVENVQERQASRLWTAAFVHRP